MLIVFNESFLLQQKFLKQNKVNNINRAVVVHICRGWFCDMDCVSCKKKSLQRGDVGGVYCAVGVDVAFDHGCVLR